MILQLTSSCRQGLSNELESRGPKQTRFSYPCDVKAAVSTCQLWGHLCNRKSMDLGSKGTGSNADSLPKHSSYERLCTQQGEAMAPTVDMAGRVQQSQELQAETRQGWRMETPEATHTPCPTSEKHSDTLSSSLRPGGKPRKVPGGSQNDVHLQDAEVGWRGKVKVGGVCTGTGLRARDGWSSVPSVTSKLGTC